MILQTTNFLKNPKEFYLKIKEISLKKVTILLQLKFCILRKTRLRLEEI